MDSKRNKHATLGRALSLAGFGRCHGQQTQQACNTGPRIHSPASYRAVSGRTCADDTRLFTQTPVTHCHLACHQRSAWSACVVEHRDICLPHTCIGRLLRYTANSNVQQTNTGSACLCSSEMVGQGMADDFTNGWLDVESMGSAYIERKATYEGAAGSAHQDAP